MEPAPADTALLQAGQTLLDRWGTESLLVTLSEQGIMLFQRTAPPFHIPTRAQEVYDVSGAGDTTIALFTLALCAGASATEAALIARQARDLGITVPFFGGDGWEDEQLLSIGGEALQFSSTGSFPSLTRVVLYRRVPADGEMSVLLGLAGYGDAYFDDVSIQRIEAKSSIENLDNLARRPSPRLPSTAPPATATARGSGVGTRSSR